MKRAAYRIRGIWAAALLLVLFVPVAHALEVPEILGYVNDYAGIISPDVKSRMEEMLNTLDRTSSNKIMVLTVPTLEGQLLEEFALKVFRVWNTGTSKLDNGVILIVVKKEGNIRIAAGRALEEKMTALAAGRITDTIMAPKFRAGDYDAGILEGIDAIIPVLKGQYSASVLRDFWGGSFLRYISENSATVFTYALIMMLGASLISRLFKSVLGEKFLPGRMKRSKSTFGALGGAVCGPVAGYWMMAETSLLAWLFYVCSGALLVVLGMHMRFSSSTSGSSSSSGGGGFSGGGGSFGGGGASGDY